MNMKSYRDKKNEDAKKLNNKIWKALNIEKVIKDYGFKDVKMSLSKWIKYQQENAKLLKEKRTLEDKLAEIASKL